MRTLFLLALLPAAARGGEISVEAFPEAGEPAAVRVRARSPGLSKGTFLTVSLERDFGTLVPRSCVLQTFNLVSREDGLAETVLSPGALLKEPGRYRVRVTYDPRRQCRRGCPGGEAGAKPKSGEARFERGLDSPAFLRVVLEEQRSLSAALLKAAEVLGKIESLGALASEDREKGLAEWRAWRGPVVEWMDRTVAHCRGSARHLFPETSTHFGEFFLYMGVLQMEDRRFLALEAGGQYHATGSFGSGARKPEDILVGLRAQCGREAVYYRLMVLDALFQGISREIGLQARRPAPDRWGKGSAEWKGLLAFWSADLGDEGSILPEAARKELGGLGKAFTEWISAEEAFLAGSGADPAFREAARQQVKERFAAVQALIRSP